MIMMIRLIWCCILIDIIAGAKLMNCPIPNIRFEKILGIRPADNSHPILLFQQNSNGDSLHPVTTECISKCHANDQCRSFVLFYNISTCFWYRTSQEGGQEVEFVVDNNVAWFAKTCLQVNNCNKLWVMERIPGSILLGEDTNILPEPIPRTDCQQYCLNNTEFLCRSVKFRIVQANYGPNSETKGICTLSSSDRHLLPNSYRVSSYDEEYFENQCVGNHNSTLNEFCAYEEYDNVTLGHVDILYDKKSKEECQRLCEQTTNFHCRAFSIIPKDQNTCILHSEDSKIHGPKLLKDTPGATYFEKARCLNISVSCNETYMTVQYYPELLFKGRLYMQGYFEQAQCFAEGQGKNLVTLQIPLLSNQCGITRAEGPSNRTLLSNTMILQYNNLIQTQGDRVIRVGCIFGNESKILVGTGVTISPSLPNKGSALVSITTPQNTTINPSVDIKILDLHTQQEVSNTQIGQELQLVIEAKPAKGPYDIWAGHLIAMTEKSEESIFLLDDRGCPTNVNIFPGLQREITNDSRRLTATFQAFKFASSPVVRFSVIVQFCANECPPIKCANNVISFGRKKREIMSRMLHTINGTTVMKVDREEFESRNKIINEMPLMYIMLVRDPKTSTERLVYGESRNKVLVAGYDYSTNEVCVEYSLFIGLIVTWVLIHIIFVVCCIILVRRYKRYYEHECTRQSLEELNKNFGIGFSNLENRHVHWADNGDIT